MNAADGSGVTRITSNSDEIRGTDWGRAMSAAPPPADTTPPVLTVPANKVIEATGPNGAQVKYTVTAQDNVDGTATLQEDGKTVTQDDVGGDIGISCNPSSGSTFPIGKTTVNCTATDAAGNTGRASFTVTVNAPKILTGSFTVSQTATTTTPASSATAANLTNAVPGLAKGSSHKITVDITANYEYNTATKTLTLDQHSIKGQL
ncbi:MAG: HYR domain-containing protein [Thermoproteota archaeon]|nr:HYR domain-containing protein [Thermoproteota archaeon]